MEIFLPTLEISKKQTGSVRIYGNVLTKMLFNNSTSKILTGRNQQTARFS